MATKKKSDTVKVQFRVTTIGYKRGDVVEVDPDTAEALISNGHALAVEEPAEQPAQG